MAKDHVVTSQTSIDCDSDYSYNEDLMDLVLKLMKDFKYVKSTQSKLK